MGNQYTWAINGGHGDRARRISVALSDLELGRLQAYVRATRGAVPGITQSAVIRIALADYLSRISSLEAAPE